MKRMTVSCELWSINRWLRFTGWRLFVTARGINDTTPTRIGFVFYGWRS